MGGYEEQLGSMIGGLAGLMLGAAFFGKRLAPFVLKPGLANLSELREAFTAAILVFGPSLIGMLLGEYVQQTFVQ